MISGSQGENKDGQEPITSEEGSHSAHSALPTSEVIHAWSIGSKFPPFLQLLLPRHLGYLGECSVHSVAQLLSEGSLIITCQPLTPQPRPNLFGSRLFIGKGHVRTSGLPLPQKSFPTVALRVRPSPHGLQQELDTCWQSTGFPKGQGSGTALHSHVFRSECGASSNSL